MKGGQATEGGSEALQAEMLYNQNNEFVGWRTHYRSWGLTIIRGYLALL
ncbi:hypothetical protein LWM68_15535 [Niabella sp. W65]|nr:hypothetical protein [Niabella sp. W65]MCH7364041.1 hypothetical protein [Niabella sp. W65]